MYSVRQNCILLDRIVFCPTELYSVNRIRDVTNGAPHLCGSSGTPAMRCRAFLSLADTTTKYVPPPLPLQGTNVLCSCVLISIEVDIQSGGIRDVCKGVLFCMAGGVLYHLEVGMCSTNPPPPPPRPVSRMGSCPYPSISVGEELFAPSPSHPLSSHT